MSNRKRIARKDPALDAKYQRAHEIRKELGKSKFDTIWSAMQHDYNHRQYLRYENS